MAFSLRKILSSIRRAGLTVLSALGQAAHTVQHADYRGLWMRVKATSRQAWATCCSAARTAVRAIRTYDYRGLWMRIRAMAHRARLTCIRAIQAIRTCDYRAAAQAALRYLSTLPHRIRTYDYRAAARRAWALITALPGRIRRLFATVGSAISGSGILSTLDRYILRKYLGSFLLSMAMILAICVVIDISEKLDAFYDNHAPLSEIVFDYYVNFIPYFANMLTPLFAFISVIFFTSKMAYNTEIIAILAGGVSFNRMLKPYVVGSMLIVVMSFVMSGYVIPPANRTRLDFEDKYVAAFKNQVAIDIQLEVRPGVILYIERFEHERNRGTHFSLERFEGKKLVSRTTGQTIDWTPEDSVWHISQYMTRDFDGIFETVTTGANMDTLIDVVPQEFFINEQYAPQMTNAELRHYIRRQNERGMGNTQAFEVEYHKRYSMPLASLILMLIGVSLASKKQKGGTGLLLGLGIVMSAVYILFMTVSSMFAIKGNMPVILAVWLPNIVFSAIAVMLYAKAPK